MSTLEATTGLPHGSLISPVIFAICIAEILQAMESQVEGSRGISFVDDVTCIVERADINRAVQRVECCAAASLRWSDDNAVRFETSKTVNLGRLAEVIGR